MIVSGHNLGTAEIESAMTTQNVCETAIVGFSHGLKEMEYMPTLFVIKNQKMRQN